MGTFLNFHQVEIEECPRARRARRARARAQFISVLASGATGVGAPCSVKLREKLFLK